MQKQGLFTSLGEHRRTSPRKKDRETNREEDSQGGVSFRNRGEFGNSTQKKSDANPNASLNASPIKVDYASGSGRTPIARIQYSPGQPSGLNTSLPNTTHYSPSPGQHAAIHSSFTLPQTQQHHHPNAIKTIIHTPIPIINPIIIESAPSSNREDIESLNDQVKMLMEQYTYVYGLYEDLMKTKKQSVSTGIATSKAPTTSRKPTEIPSQSTGSHRLAIQQSHIQSLFHDFELSMNATIDRIIDARIREGSHEISKITLEAQQSVEVRYY
jgi:hypothetical protein